MARRRKLRARALASFSLFLAACTGPAALPPITISEDAAALAALEEETGHAWQLRRHPTLRTPATLDGRTRPLATTPRDADRAARAFLSRHRQLFRMGSPDEELASIGSLTDELGMTHARFRQRIGRLPIWDGDLLVHFDVDGALVRINGRYGPIEPPESLEPRITSDEARVSVALLARQARPLSPASAFSTQPGELVLFPMEEGTNVNAPRPARLAWRVRAEADDVERPLRLEALLDAHDGRLLAAFDRVDSLDGSGLGVFGDRKPLVVEQKKTAYWLEDRGRGSETPTRTFSAGGKARLPGSQLRSSDPERWDTMPVDGVAGAAVDAHAHVAVAWDYFEREHGRLGFADNDRGVRSTVHYGHRVSGAFFDGEQLIFGDGDAGMSPSAASLDVVGHEFTHGVIAASAGLLPFGEPGAIAEGMADLFGCLIAWTSGQGGRWQIAETIFHPKGRNRALRDLADPHATSQPDQLSEIDPASLLGFDQTAMHDNAAIVGRLGYLLVEGDGAAVTSLGPTTTGRIFYRALTSYLYPRAGFADLGDALRFAARDLGTELEPAVEAALVVLGLR